MFAMVTVAKFISTIYAILPFMSMSGDHSYYNNVS